MTTETKKVQPHSLDSEEGVIGSLLIDGAAITAIKETLKVDHFFYAVNQLMYAACLAIAERHDAIDQITVAQELTRKGNLETCGGAANLSRLISICPTALDIENYANIVHRLFVSRELIRTGERIADIGYQALPESNQALDTAVDIVNGCRKANAQLERLITPYQVGNVIMGEDINGDPPRADSYNHLSWGFRDLDEATVGMYPNELIIFGARPSVGKTQLLGDVAQGIAERERERVILFVSAEMSLAQIVERIKSRALGISVKALRRDILTDEQLSEIMKLAGVISEGNTYYMPEGTSSGDIYAQAQRLKQTKGLDIVFVDYLQLLSDAYGGPGENMTVKVGKCSKTMKAIAKDFNVPVLCASQLSRESEKREDKLPRLSDLRYSGDIEQDADIVLLLHRTTENPEILRLYMDKHRQYGALDSYIELVWNSKRYRYVDKPRDAKQKPMEGI